MEAVSLSNRALLTEVIPTARVEERREREPLKQEGELQMSTDACVHARTHTNTHTQILTQCPSQSWVVTGPWHWPGMSTMFAKPSITHPPSLLKQELLFRAYTC